MQAQTQHPLEHRPLERTWQNVAACIERCADGIRSWLDAKESDPLRDAVGTSRVLHGFADRTLTRSRTFGTAGQVNSTFMILVMSLRIAGRAAKEAK